MLMACWALAALLSTCVQQETRKPKSGYGGISHGMHMEDELTRPRCGQIESKSCHKCQGQAPTWPCNVCGVTTCVKCAASQCLWLISMHGTGVISSFEQLCLSGAASQCWSPPVQIPAGCGAATCLCQPCVYASSSCA